MVKNVLKTLRIDEISAVDDPAQEGARVVIFKRRDVPADVHNQIEKEVPTMNAIEGYEAVTNAIAQVEGITKAAAGVKTLDRVPDIYRSYKRAQDAAAHPARSEILRKRESAEAQLNKLATDRARETGETVAKAMTAILQTATGERLYDEAYARKLG
jgi:hypothetical protein